MTVLILIGVAAAAYFLGGLNGAIITSRLVYKEDIREHGSGNPGLTNFYRTYGGKAIFLLILIDVCKTALPVVVCGSLLENYADFGTVSERILVGRAWAGLFAMVGHAYPCLYGFKGGKCVLAGGTVALFMGWQVTAIVFGVFLLTVVLTRYVSLGSLLAGILFPFAFIIVGNTGWHVIIAALCGLLLIYRHRENIVRLLRGEERKFSFKRSGEQAPAEGVETDGEAAVAANAETAGASAPAAPEDRDGSPAGADGERGDEAQ